MATKVGALKEISFKYRNYFFDLDGWKSTEPIQSCIQALSALRKNKQKVFFITNNSTRNQRELLTRFQHFGIPASLQEIYTSSYTSGLFIKKRFPQIQRILTVGAEGMATQLSEMGFDVVRLTDSNYEYNLPKMIESLDLTRQAILMGFDGKFTYQKLCIVALYVQKGLKLFGTNPDRCTISSGFKIPGAGSMIASVEAACDVKAEICCKPNPFILEEIIDRFGLKKSECLMIGDNIETDIVFGLNAGIDTLCVLTGVTTQEEIIASNIKTYYCEKLQDLF